MLAAHLRRRFARQLLLPEIGESGQQRLLATRVAAVRASYGAQAGTQADPAGSGGSASVDPCQVDPRAMAVARDYLERAGIAWSTDAVPAASVDPASGGSPSSTATLALATARQVQEVAGTAALEEAAAALLGAHAAVELIKQVTGAGVPARFPQSLVLKRAAQAAAGER